MSYTHTITITYNGGSSPIITGSNEYTAGAESNISESIATGTNTLVAFTADVSQMKTLLLYSDVSMTIKTNSSGSPDATVTLVAGQPLVWNSINGQTNPFGSTDVTALYATNASTAAFTLKCLFDPTV